LAGPRLAGPHGVEDGARRQSSKREPARATEKRSPIDVPVLVATRHGCRSFLGTAHLNVERGRSNINE
jgi:hypothetical protein